MPLSIVTAAATTPVSVAEFKTHARVSEDAEDAYLADVLLPAATRRCEQFLGRQFVSATLRYELDRFPCEIDIETRLCGLLRLPRPPLVSVSAIVYVDPQGVPQTLAAPNYQVDAVAQPGRVAPAYGLSWPAHRRQLRSVQITYVAGYGAASAVPATLRLAVLTLAATMFEHRDLDVALPRQVADLLRLEDHGAYVV